MPTLSNETEIRWDHFFTVICGAMGVRKDDVRSIDISCDAGGHVTVVIEHIPRGRALTDALTELLRVEKPAVSTTYPKAETTTTQDVINELRRQSTNRA